jgi:subtilisin family serine protease
MVELEVLNVLDNKLAAATAWDVAVRMAAFADSDVNVINLSLGCYTDDGDAPLLLKRAVELLTPQTIVVAAAGNHGAGVSAAGEVTPRTPFWPAALDDVVAVGAHDSDGQRAAFSPDTPWITLSAPGVDVASTYLRGAVEIPLEGSTDGATELQDFGGYAIWSGTSFAAAAVSGKIAAGTVPGRRTAREALDDLMNQSPTDPGVDVWAYDHGK